MLNELLILKRGAEQANIDLLIRHPDIKKSRNIPTLVVSIDPVGNVTGIRTKPDDVVPWTLRDGMHNSFPFMQLKQTVTKSSSDVGDELVDRIQDPSNPSRRDDFLSWLDNAQVNIDEFIDWPGNGLLERIKERRAVLSTLNETDAAVVPATMSNFLTACKKPGGGTQLLESVVAAVTKELPRNAEKSFLEAAIGFLLGKLNKKTGVWENQTAMLMEADNCDITIYHRNVIDPLSECLNNDQSISSDKLQSKCGLTAETTRTIDDKFPQPNLPVLGQTYLFARNSAAKANSRYGKTSVSTMPVGVDTANSLSATIRALTDKNREHVTWRPIPGEAPKQTDLLLAYVDASPNIPISEWVCGDFEDESKEQTEPDSVSTFEKQSGRIVSAIQGIVEGDFRKSRASFFVFRKVDPANRKIIYSDQRTIGKLYDSASEWVKAERNAPPGLTMFAKFGKSKPKNRKPPHLAPLGLVAFSKKVFRRSGADSQDIAGITAAEAMSLFLISGDRGRSPSIRRHSRFLRMVLRRRGQMCSCAIHRLRLHDYELVNHTNREALRTVTVLSVLLYQLGRPKEVFMNETAYKLGQLLAAADVVHAGYCADVRNGLVPPSLLGNQIFSMAQSTPSKALAVLCRRWKPYDGWMKKLLGSPDRLATIDKQINNEKNKAECRRAWDIKRALRNWREMKAIAESLKDSIPQCKINDKFRTELLLGYMAGIPAAAKDHE